MKTDLGADLGFLKLRNPILTASGTFGYGLEFEPFLDLNELGGFVVKGLYYGPREGNPPPRLVETPMGLINAIGLQGIGAEAFADKVLPRLKTLKTALIVNVCGETEEEYVRVVEYLGRREGISAFELNISCPNVREGGACPAMEPQTTFRLVQAVKKASPIPIITKLSPNVTDIAEIARAAEAAGADALSLINTVLGMAIDIETRRPLIARRTAGLSGPAIKPIAIARVYQVRKAVKLPLI